MLVNRNLSVGAYNLLMNTGVLSECDNCFRLILPEEVTLIGSDSLNIPENMSFPYCSSCAFKARLALQ